MKRAFAAAAVVGGLWALVEVIFAYVVATAPAWDAVEIFLAPLAASLLYHALFFAAGRVRPHRAFDVLIRGGLLLPAVVFLLRSRGQLAPLHLLAGLVPIALCLVLVVSETRKPTEAGWMTPWRILSIQTLYFGAAVAFVLRNDRVGAVVSEMLLGAAAWCAAVVLVATAAVALSRRYASAALLGVLTAASLVVAWQRGSGPPTYRIEKAGVTSQPSPKTSLPNVLLIVLDTVRADHLDLYGYSRPTFERTSRFLEDGLVFDRATSSGTFSLTSHGSLFTGLLPSSHGAHPVIGGAANYARLWPDITTMASFLRERGYRTAGVSGNDIFLAPWTGLQKGFDTFFSSGLRSQRFVPFGPRVRRLLSRVRLLRRRIPSSSWPADQVTDAAIDIASDPRQPFFLFVNYFDAHEPHVLTGSPPWQGQGRARPIDAYDSEIAFIDGEVTRLLAFLRERGELDRTLLIVTADHGEYFNERSLRGHPPAAYEQSTHIPLAVRMPGTLGSGRSGRRTGLHEVFRMVQDVVSGNSLDWLTQIDLTPRILNEGWGLRDYGPVQAADGRPSITVVFEGNLKLIHRLSGRLELFDLESDPGEEKSLIDSKDPRIIEAKERMIREVMLRATRGPGPVQALSEDVKERLRALGYIR